MDLASSKTKKFADSWSKAGRSVQSSINRIGLASVGIGGVVIKRFAEFERQMIRVGAVTETIGTKSFAVLEAAARSAGRTTVFTATESAQAIAKLGLAGLSTSEIIGGALKSSLQLAAAAQIDIATAADISAKQLRAFKLEASDLGRINDTLIATQARSNTTILQLAEALKPVAPLAAQAGVSLEQTAAILAKMADAGFQGSIAGVALRRTFINLAGTTKEVREHLKRMGIQAVDPLFVKLTKVKKALDGAANETEALRIAAEVFGARAAAPMIAALSDGVESLEEFTQGLLDAGGIAERITEAQLNTLWGAFRILRSKIADVGIEVGKVLNPHLRALIQIVQDNQQGLTDFAVTVGTFTAKILKLMALHPKVAGFFALFGAAHLLGITNAVKTLALAIGTTLTAAITASGTAATIAWAKITLGISLVVTAIAAMILKFDSFRHFLYDLFGMTKNEAVNLEKKVIKLKNTLVNGFKKVVAVVKSLLAPLVQIRDEFVARFEPEIAAALHKIKVLWAEVVEEFKPFYELVLPVALKILKYVFQEVAIPLMKLFGWVITNTVITGLELIGWILENVVLPHVIRLSTAIDGLIWLWEKLGIINDKQGRERIKQMDEEAKKRREELDEMEEKIALNAQLSKELLPNRRRERLHSRYQNRPGDPDFDRGLANQKRGLNERGMPAGDPLGIGDPSASNNKTGAPGSSSGGANRRGGFAPRTPLADVQALEQDLHDLRVGNINQETMEFRQGARDRANTLEALARAEQNLNIERQLGIKTDAQHAQELLKIRTERVQLQIEDRTARNARQTTLRRDAEARERVNESLDDFADEGVAVIDALDAAGVETGEFLDALVGLIAPLRGNIDLTKEETDALREKIAAGREAVTQAKQAQQQRILDAARSNTALNAADQAAFDAMVNERQGRHENQQRGNDFDRLIDHVAGVNTTLQQGQHQDRVQHSEIVGQQNALMQAYTNFRSDIKPQTDAFKKYLDSGADFSGLANALRLQIHDLRLLLNAMHGSKNRRSGYRRQQEIQARLAEAIRQLNEHLKAPSPAFSAGRMGFEGLIDPGLQGSGDASGSGGTTIIVNTQATDGHQLVQDLELELQRVGKRI